LQSDVQAASLIAQQGLGFSHGGEGSPGALSNQSPSTHPRLKLFAEGVSKNSVSVFCEHARPLKELYGWAPTFFENRSTIYDRNPVMFCYGYERCSVQVDTIREMAVV